MGLAVLGVLGQSEPVLGQTLRFLLIPLAVTAQVRRARPTSHRQASPTPQGVHLDDVRLHTRHHPCSSNLLHRTCPRLRLHLPPRQPPGRAPGRHAAAPRRLRSGGAGALRGGRQGGADGAQVGDVETVVRCSCDLQQGSKRDGVILMERKVAAMYMTLCIAGRAHDV